VDRAARLDQDTFARIERPPAEQALPAAQEGVCHLTSLADDSPLLAPKSHRHGDSEPDVDVVVMVGERE